MGQRRQQHSKGKKRPGGWHQGPGLAAQQIPRLEALERAEQREAGLLEGRAEMVADVKEHAQIRAGLRRVAPFVPGSWPELLLVAAVVLGSWGTRGL